MIGRPGTLLIIIIYVSCYTTLLSPHRWLGIREKVHYNQSQAVQGNLSIVIRRIPVCTSFYICERRLEIFTSSLERYAATQWIRGLVHYAMKRVPSIDRCRMIFSTVSSLYICLRCIHEYAGMGSSVKFKHFTHLHHLCVWWFTGGCLGSIFFYWVIHDLDTVSHNLLSFLPVFWEIICMI